MNIIDHNLALVLALAPVAFTNPAPAPEAAPSAAVTAAAPSEAAAKVLDLRRASGSVEYRVFVVARKRDGVLEWPGHLYFMVAAHDEGKRATIFSDENAFGFYPKRNSTSVWLDLKVPGEVREAFKDDLDRDLITHRLEIRLDADAHTKLRTAVQRWADERKKYELTGSNCVEFVQDCLATLQKETSGAADKLVVPQKYRFTTPQAYMKALFEANGMEF